MNQDISSQISAPGRKIILSNGNEITIRYGMSALIEIEREYGSVGALATKLQDKTGPVFTTLTHALWCGTNRKLPLAAFSDLIDPARITEYSEAFGEAFNEAMPKGESQPGEAQAAE